MNRATQAGPAGKATSSARWRSRKAASAMCCARCAQRQFPMAPWQLKKTGTTRARPLSTIYNRFTDLFTLQMSRMAMLLALLLVGWAPAQARAQDARALLSTNVGAIYANGDLTWCVRAEARGAESISCPRLRRRLHICGRRAPLAAPSCRFMVASPTQSAIGPMQAQLVLGAF